MAVCFSFTVSRSTAREFSCRAAARESTEAASIGFDPYGASQVRRGYVIRIKLEFPQGPSAQYLKSHVFKRRRGICNVFASDIGSGRVWTRLVGTGWVWPGLNATGWTRPNASARDRTGERARACWRRPRRAPARARTRTGCAPHTTTPSGSLQLRAWIAPPGWISLRGTAA